jgi:hypothetical protein
MNDVIDPLGSHPGGESLQKTVEAVNVPQSTWMFLVSSGFHTAKHLWHSRHVVMWESLVSTLVVTAAKTYSRGQEIVLSVVNLTWVRLELRNEVTRSL